MDDNLFADIEPGAGRWWKVELETSRAVSRNPIKVSLMETNVEGKLKLSTLIGFERTIAEPSMIRAAALGILKGVGNYRNVVGRYPDGAR